MLRKMVCNVMLCSALLCGVMSVFVAPAAAMDIQSIDLKGLDAALRTNQGKVIVLNFFATWCPPCREEIPGLVGLRTSLSADNLAIIGICVDENDEPIKGFVKKMKINYPVYWAKGEVPHRYNVRTIPHNVIYDTKGKIAANVTGFVSEDDLADFIQSLLDKR